MTADTDPSLLQYPTILPDVGGGGLQSHAIGVASCAALVLGLCALHAAVQPRGQTEPSRVCAVVCGVEATCAQYFAPSAVSGGVLLVRHSTSDVEVVVGGAGVLLIICVMLHRAFVVLERVPHNTECVRQATSSRGTVKCVWTGALAISYGAYFDGCRDGKRALLRMAYFVELGCSLVMSVAAGWRPVSGSCAAVALSMLVACLLLLFYMVILRPYQQMRDQMFALAFAALQVVQASAAVATTQALDGALWLLGATTLVQCLLLVAQLCVQVCWAAATSWRRKVQAGDSSQNRSLMTSILAVPRDRSDPTELHQVLLQ